MDGRAISVKARAGLSLCYYIARRSAVGIQGSGRQPRPDHVHGGLSLQPSRATTALKLIGVALHFPYDPSAN